MWSRLRAALLRLLPSPGAAPQDREDPPASRKRPRPCMQQEEEEHSDTRHWKRFKMGDLVDSVRTTARGVQRTTGEVLSWVRGQSSPSPRARTPTPTWGRRGSSTPGLTPPRPPPPPPPTPLPPAGFTRRQGLRETLDASFTSASGRPVYSTQRGRKISPATGVALGSGDHRPPPPGKRSPRTPRPPGKENGVSRRRVSPRTQSLTGIHLPARNARRPLRDTFISMYDKTFGGVGDGGGDIRTPPSISSPRSRGSPTDRPPTHRSTMGHGRSLSTVEESILHEEKEIYRQLLEVVTADYDGSSNRNLLTKVCSPLSHRELPGFRCPSQEAVLKEMRLDSPWAPNSPLGSESPWWTPSPPSTPEPGPDPGPPEGCLGLDTTLTGSDSESVIVVKVKDASRPDPMRASTFDSVHWINELISIYDSRALERKRLIEEQHALADRLKQQRLQEQVSLRQHVVPQLHLRVPLIEEIPIADLPPEEPTEDRPRVQHEEEEEHFPQLTEEMEAAVRRAFQAGDLDDVLSEAFRLTITRKDIHTLNHLNWLNDEVINFYMNLLVSRSEEASLPSVHTFNTFFFPKLKTDGYQAVRRWTKRVDIFTVDILLVPVHLGVHWCLTVVDLRKKTISYYDSMGGRNDAACQILLQYLKEESLDKRSTEFDTRDWVLGSKGSQEIPQQMNGSDCGVFTCKYADYITQDRPIRFTQKHMPYFRKRMAWEILSQKLL